MWAILIVTLPTQPNAVRLRIWRALKALGCVALRDGAYLLPDEHASALEALGVEVREHGGTASVLTLVPRDEAQRAEVLAQFDRTEAYGQWRDGAVALQGAFANLGETEARRRLRSVSDNLQALQRTDYYPGAASQQADLDLRTLRQAFDEQFSKGEPQPGAHADAGLERLSADQFVGKTWATRARPWVDRLACAWLIQRFIDPQARFVWLTDTARAKRGVIGFDYDGARFTHVATRVTFEVLASSFGLDNDPKLRRIGATVHFLDVGGIPVAEAPGLEAVLCGLREVHADDDQLVLAASAVFNALYAAPEGSP